MQKPKSYAYVFFCILLCFAFAIGSNYGLERIIQRNLIYDIKMPKNIGAVYMTYNNPFYSVVNEEISKVVKKHGDNLINLDPSLSLKKQKEQINDLIDQRVDALVITPVRFKGLTKELKRAKQYNIPVIIVDTEVADSKFVSYNVSSDNYNAGVQCAQDMMAELPSARIALLEHNSAYSGYMRIKGFLDTIQDHPEYQVVKHMDCKGQLEKAMPATKAFLKENIPFDVLMCLNDPSALGGMAALEEMNQLDGKYVYGIDGTPEAKQLVEEGRMRATVAQSPKTMGQKAAKAIYCLLDHKKIAPRVEVLPVQKITKDNVSAYLSEEWQ